MTGVGTSHSYLLTVIWWSGLSRGEIGSTAPVFQALGTIPFQNALEGVKDAIAYPK